MTTVFQSHPDGKKYTIRMTVGKIQDVEEACGINLLAQDALEAIARQPIKFAEVCYHLIVGDDVEKDAWLADLDGDMLGALEDAFFQELYAFFKGHRPKVAELLKALREKTKQADEAMGDLALSKVDQMDEMIAAKLKEADAAMDDVISGETSLD